MRLKNAPVGSHVIVPDSMPVHRSSLESTLSMVRAGHISDALVTNKTGSTITLNSGVVLATYEVLGLSSLGESLPLPVAGVTAHDADVIDLTDVMAQLKPHVSVLDFPATKPALLQLLAKHRQAIAVPGEPLGVTTSHTSHSASAWRSTFLCPFLSAAI